MFENVHMANNTKANLPWMFVSVDIADNFKVKLEVCVEDNMWK